MLVVAGEAILSVGEPRVEVPLRVQCPRRLVTRGDDVRRSPLVPSDTVGTPACAPAGTAHSSGTRANSAASTRSITSPDSVTRGSADGAGPGCAASPSPWELRTERCPRPAPFHHGRSTSRRPALKRALAATVIGAPSPRAMPTPMVRMPVASSHHRGTRRPEPPAGTTAAGTAGTTGAAGSLLGGGATGSAAPGARARARASACHPGAFPPRLLGALDPARHLGLSRHEQDDRDVVGPTALVGRLDEPRHRVLVVAPLDERVQLVVLDEVVQPVAAQQHHVAGAQLQRLRPHLGLEALLHARAAPQRLHEHVRVGMIPRLLGREDAVAISCATRRVVSRAVDLQPCRRGTGRGGCRPPSPRNNASSSPRR